MHLYCTSLPSVLSLPSNTASLNHRTLLYKLERVDTIPFWSVETYKIKRTRGETVVIFMHEQHTVSDQGYLYQCGHHLGIFFVAVRKVRF